LKQFGSLTLVCLLLLTSCMPDQVPSRKLAGANVAPGGSGGSVGGVGVGVTSGSGGGGPLESAPPRVEIRNLVEPKITTGDYPNYFTGTGLSGAGTYVRKLTLPQNYQGFLYLGGININSLAGKFVKVRFTFGVSREQVEIPATVARAPGITPNTEIDVLVMDLSNKPFDNQRLIYDLYDYKDYGNDPEQIVGEPAETNRDSSLYCRALRLQDDPTFNGVGACDGLPLTSGGLLNDEKCLYTYTKVIDRALVRVNPTTGVETAVYPSLPQVDLTVAKSGYYNQNPSHILNRCLPDKSISTPTVIASGLNDEEIENGLATSNGISFLQFDLNNFLNPIAPNKFLVQNQTVTPFNQLFSQQVRYYGPFKAINSDNWEMKGPLVFSPNGLFDPGGNLLPSYDPSMNFELQIEPIHLYRSKMFPRFGYMDLGSNIQYLKTDPENLDSKTVGIQPQGGETELVDGCNLRIQSINTQGEHIGSCNATGKIEILASETGSDYTPVAATNEVILQLVRGTQISGEGEEYLYSNFKTCENSNQCGSNECCFNNRCWSNDLVAQCVEQAPATGNQPIGSVCQSDFECSSLCCNLSTGRCGVHDNRLNPPVLCNKPFGQFCLAKEWCQKSNVVNCYIVKTGTDPQGNITCAKRCYNSQEFGDCRQGLCVPPLPGLNPDFDPNDPNACEDAIDPPNI
jgi:hypothetical protein